MNHTCDCILLAVFFSWLPTYTHDVYPEKPVLHVYVVDVCILVNLHY